jgi:hypothetical protein
MLTQHEALPAQRRPKPGDAPAIRIRWKRYTSSEDVKECEFVLYLHEGDGKPWRRRS